MLHECLTELDTGASFPATAPKTGSIGGLVLNHESVDPI